MTSVPRLSKIMQTLLTDIANESAHATRFVQRRSKVTGAVFVQALVFGWLSNPRATLEELTKVVALQGVSLTPQGLDQRFSERVAHCLLQVLNSAIQQMVCADGNGTTAPLLERFAGVYLHDSSVLTLPRALAKLWPGCGNQANPSATSASLKLQVRLELHSGSLNGPHLQSGRIHDGCSPHQDVDHIQYAQLPQGALRIADLGFFSLGVLAQLQRRAVFWLTRVHGHTAVFDQAGDRRELGALLAEQASYQQSERLDIAVQLGAIQRLPCRLVAVRVPVKIAAQRRSKLRQEAKRRGRNVSSERLRQTDWNILATNVPIEKLSIEEVLVLARSRWQIELLFKLWKSHGGIDEWRTQNPVRIMCEVYAKLLAMVIQHWLLLISCWADMWVGGRSMVKAAGVVRQYVLHIAIAAQFGKAHRLSEAIRFVQSCISTGCRINKRKTKPHFYQLLHEPTLVLEP
ncbi:MAG: IS4 family transposase [Chloroflexia bacterium]